MLGLELKEGLNIKISESVSATAIKKEIIFATSKRSIKRFAKEEFAAFSVLFEILN